MTKRLSIIFLSAVALLECFPGVMQAQPRSQTRAEEVYNQGIAKTGREDYRGAIADFQQAATLFNQSGNLSNAYKSQALATYWQLTFERIQRTTPSNESLPGWYVGGSCVGNPVCKYSVVFVNPGAESSNFGGVVILEEKLRMLNRPDGTGEPINAVLDAQTVPKLRQGEYFAQIGCQMRRGRTQNLFVAIAQTNGYENADFYPARLAWRINLTSKKIESIPATNIRCENPCPGGC
ncbi:hypothetical protein [Microseira wollei]|uniref:Tetratricopeptide repeat protein n=1 Tax=Microseira wollei NIES-4236 TaxID=2530354 RepID=A0AAV3XBU8_9CYAN|nr:hypothetical protein [Microseira wollei]GET36852.1 hypothetical protein MiSe_16040 [Microseira wollei NIES-4236]